MARVVLVDDDDTIRPSIRKMIESDAHTVVEFNDAAPALDYITATNTDCVVTDLEMQTSGRVLIQTLRARDIHIPIVIITGYLSPSDADQLLHLGATSILFKPFTLDELQNAIQV